MSPGGDIGAAVDATVRRHLETGGFAGAVVRVERRGAPALEGAWGHALRAGSERVPMRPGTLFDLASVTKLFTATAILRLATSGELDLGAKAADLLWPIAGAGGAGPRDAPDRGDRAGSGDGAAAEALAGIRARLLARIGDVDLRSLLCHSTGIHYWYPFYTRRGEGFEAILADVLDEHPRAPAPVYSDLNFMILGKVVEAATGRRLSGAMRELVIAPLGLGSARYASELRPEDRAGAAATEFGNRIERRMVSEIGRSFGSWRDESVPIRGEADDGNCHYYFGGEAGHAGLFADAKDLCALGRLYLETGRAGGANFIEPGLAAEARVDHGGGRGLGFQLGPNYPRGGFGHTGFTGTYLYVNAEAGLVVAALANRLHAADPRDINDFRREVAQAALGD